MLLVKEYTKYLLLAYLVAILFLGLIGIIFAYTNINDSLLNIFIFVIVVITNLFGSMMLLRKIKRRGLLFGLIFGLIYFLILYLLSVIFYTGFFINTSVLIYFVIAIVSGMVGGIVGVNIR